MGVIAEELVHKRPDGSLTVPQFSHAAFWTDGTAMEVVWAQSVDYAAAHCQRIKAERPGGVTLIAQVWPPTDKIVQLAGNVVVGVAPTLPYWRRVWANWKRVLGG